MTLVRMTLDRLPRGTMTLRAISLALGRVAVVTPLALLEVRCRRGGTWFGWHVPWISLLTRWVSGGCGWRRHEVGCPRVPTPTVSNVGATVVWQGLLLLVLGVLVLLVERCKLGVEALDKAGRAGRRWSDAGHSIVPAAPGRPRRDGCSVRRGTRHMVWMLLVGRLRARLALQLARLGWWWRLLRLLLLLDAVLDHLQLCVCRLILSIGALSVAAWEDPAFRQLTRRGGAHGGT